MISLKQRFTINFSILFSALLAVVLIIVLFIFAQFRKNEFRMRLEEKALSTAALLADFNVSKQDALGILDQNSIDKLYNDRILVFGNDLNLIYSSVSGATPILSAGDLQLLKIKGSFSDSNNNIVRFGMTRNLPNNKVLYVIVSAEDKSGHRLLWFLGYLLLGAFVTGTVSVIILARSLSGRILLPLKQIQERITNISENRLHLRLEEKPNNDEIDKLARAFNDMMDRINASYKQQKEFTDHASHELRTPVTRIIMQIENLIKNEPHNEKTLQYLNSIMSDSNQIADTISSLLLLSRIESTNFSGFLPPCRLDEIIFESIQTITKAYPDVRTLFNIDNQTDNEIDLEIKGDSNLLKIVFINLFKNAYLYSSDKLIDVTLIQEAEKLHATSLLKVTVVNDGEVIASSERQNLFQAFARGKNAKNIKGTGLGLRISERILNYHHATIQYEATDQDKNRFTISFSGNNMC
jgi:signal transduction histidine kinase